MVRESTFDDTRKEIRAGRLALISPVIHVDGRPLRREDQMDSHGARHLGEPCDGFLDLATGDHHEVSEFVDRDDDVGERLRRLVRIVR